MNNYKQKLILLCVLLLGCVLTSMGVEYFGSSQQEVVAVPTEFLEKQESVPKVKEVIQTKKSFSNLEESSGFRNTSSNLEKTSSVGKFYSEAGNSSSTRKTSPKNKNTTDVSKTLVNINTATLAELDTLPGVGVATAKKIIAYREAKPFDSIEEIMEVKGIGKAKFAKMRERITVE